MDKNKFNIEGIKIDIPMPKRVLPDFKEELKKVSIDYDKLMAPLRKYSKIAEVMSENFNYYSRIDKIFKDAFKFDFSEIFKGCNIPFIDVLFNNCRFLGGLEWCLFDIEEFQDTRESMILWAENIEDYLKGEDLSIDNINEYISKAFTIEKVLSVKDKTLLYLDSEDKVKLDKAFSHFEKDNYFESANLLAGLIDAQSIKQELYDNSISNTKFLDKAGNFKASQGWKSFYRMFENNLTSLFNGKSIKNKSNETYSELDLIVEDIKKDSCYDIDIVCPIVYLAYCLCIFFDDSNWTDYPNKKPMSINRHWLMHSMYSIYDIKKYDCIKLLLMLNQLVLLYKKIRNKEI